MYQKKTFSYVSKHIFDDCPFFVSDNCVSFSDNNERFQTELQI